MLRKMQERLFAFTLSCQIQRLNRAAGIYPGFVFYQVQVFGLANGSRNGPSAVGDVDAVIEGFVLHSVNV